MSRARTSRLAVVLVFLMMLSLLSAAPPMAAADEHEASDATVEFDEVPQRLLRAGRTVPLGFSVSDAAGAVTASVVDPAGSTEDLEVEAGPGDTFLAQVPTTRSIPGYYTVVVADEGVEIGAFTFPAYLGPPSAGTDVVLLHDTHFHGKFDHDPDTGVSAIAQYMTVVADRKAALPRALFLGNGDDLAPSLLGGVFHGEHMIEAFNASSLDVNTFGNHEFDFGPENLRERIQESEFPWVTANVRDIATGEPFAADLGVERFRIQRVHRVHLGITGLGPERMAEVTSLGDETEQIPAIEAMTEVVPEMRAAGADLVVVVSHLCGSDARELAAAVDGIDVIVGDHCAEVLDEPEIINDTIVSFVGDEFDHIGELRIMVERNQVVDTHFTRHDITADITPHPVVQAIVDKWEAALDEALGEVIGFRVNEWDVRTAQVRSTETGFANYIVDTMREAADADIGLQNGGGIRSDQIFPGGEPITRRDVVEVLPFANHLVMVELDGATILAALENGVSRVEFGDGRFPQVSGLRYVWDPSAEAGSRIVEVIVGDEPLDEAATYTVATLDFLLGGGDGYTMLADGEIIIGPGEGQLSSTLVTERIIEEGDVEVATDGRISTVD